MRLSVNKDDPGFNLNAFNRGVTITVDGVQVYNCYTADEELGIAYCYVAPLTPDPNNPDKALKCEIKGVVKIFIKEDLNVEVSI